MHEFQRNSCRAFVRKVDALDPQKRQVWRKALLAPRGSAATSTTCDCRTMSSYELSCNGRPNLLGVKRFDGLHDRRSSRGFCGHALAKDTDTDREFGLSQSTPAGR